MSAIHVRRLRLGAAFVLLTYLVLHFSNDQQPPLLVRLYDNLPCAYPFSSTTPKQ